MVRKQRYYKPKEEEGELLTVTEAAQRLRVNPITISRWIKSGTIETIKLQNYRRYRIRKVVIESMLNPL